METEMMEVSDLIDKSRSRHNLLNIARGAGATPSPSRP